MRSVKLHQSREWAMALENLEQMHPRYLAKILKTPDQLAKVLETRVEAYFRTLERLREAAPNREDHELQEIATPELAPVNENWQDEDPLTPEEQMELERFRKRMSMRA